MIINTGRQVNVVKSYKRRRTAIRVLFYVVIAGVVLAVFSLTHQDDITLTGLSRGVEVGIGLGVAAGAVLAGWLTWRCPKCRGFLGLRLKVENCPKCGEKFIQTARQMTDSDAIVTMERKKIIMNLTMGAFLLAGGLLLLFSIKFAHWLGFIGMVFIAIGWPFYRSGMGAGPPILAFFMWRCPNCNERLENEKDPDRCPNCKIKL